MARGGIPRQGADADELRGHMSRGLGDANLQDDALSMGRVRQNQPIGKTDGRHVVVLLQTGINEYRFTFKRRKKPPGTARIAGYDNVLAPTSKYDINWLRKEKWTTTTGWIHVAVTSGQLAGGRVHLEIGGEQ